MHGQQVIDVGTIPSCCKSIMITHAYVHRIHWNKTALYMHAYTYQGPHSHRDQSLWTKILFIHLQRDLVICICPHVKQFTEYIILSVYVRHKNSLYFLHVIWMHETSLWCWSCRQSWWWTSVIRQWSTISWYVMRVNIHSKIKFAYILQLWLSPTDWNTPIEAKRSASRRETKHDDVGEPFVSSTIKKPKSTSI